jgi:phage terminase large subunit-like protein
MEKWDASNEKIDLEQLKGRECYGGLDLSSTTDITAFVLVFHQEMMRRALSYYLSSGYLRTI